jgi:triosephosphate isomerase (TIM)
MKCLIAANWKMNKTVKESIEIVKELKYLIKDNDKADVLVCVPFTALQSVSEELKDSSIKLGAQNMHYEDSGAYTGEISPLMLKELGCEFVILGHSDRREIFSEDDKIINKKIHAALKHSLKPILCIGENFEQKENGETNKIIEAQLGNALKDVSKEQMLQVALAYEPIWAISRGNPNVKSATTKDAGNRHKFVRDMIAKLFDDFTAKKVRILYGGSMKPENAKELLSNGHIDGGLVGNASLNAKSFVKIIESA